jgi:hypothetical protein
MCTQTSAVSNKLLIQLNHDNYDVALVVFEAYPMLSLQSCGCPLQLCRNKSRGYEITTYAFSEAYLTTSIESDKRPF